MLSPLQQKRRRGLKWRCCRCSMNLSARYGSALFLFQCPDLSCTAIQIYLVQRFRKIRFDDISNVPVSIASVL